METRAPADIQRAPLCSRPCIQTTAQALQSRELATRRLPILALLLIRYSRAMLHEIFSHMFHVPLPLLEKLLRPVIVYLVLILLLRLFGKRELAQLNPFDLVVLLSLSNTVQNAIIGDDNSISGGVIGALGLLGINWVVVKILYRAPRLS